MSFTNLHRGPFRFLVTRATATAKKPWTSVWLTGTIGSDDVDEEAEALLTDPRDSVRSINVWSVRDEQFVHSYGNLEPLEARLVEGVGR